MPMTSREALENCRSLIQGKPITVDTNLLLATLDAIIDQGGEEFGPTVRNGRLTTLIDLVIANGSLARPSHPMSARKAKLEAERRAYLKTLADKAERKLGLICAYQARP